MIHENRGKTATESDLYSNVVDYRFIREQFLPYVIVWIIYYAWVIAFATWWNASPLNGDTLDAQFRGLMHGVNLISSAVFVFLIHKEWFVRLSRIFSLVVIAGICAFFLTADSTLKLVFAIASSVAIGCMNISILIPFVFTLNNTEKFYAVIVSNILIQFLALFLEYSADKTVELLISFVMLALTVGVTWFFKKRDLENEENKQKPEIPVPCMRKGVYFTIFFSCAFAVLCKGAGKGILNVASLRAEAPLMTWYYLGGLAGCLLFVLIYKHSKRAYLWQGNITFACVAMGLFCNAFAEYAPGFAMAFAILLGIGNSMGMINVYYIMGVVGKKYESKKYVRLSILLIGICGGAAGIVLGRMISETGTFGLSIAASMVSAAIMILLITVSPFMTRSYYESDWAKDSQRFEVDNEQLHLFRQYNLSRREIEVCKLLLQGFTMRQISGILSLAYPTVNTYCTSIYRKTSINSRAELMRIFKEYSDTENLLV